MLWRTLSGELSSERQERLVKARLARDRIREDPGSTWNSLHMLEEASLLWFHACCKHVCCLANAVSMWMVTASLEYLVVLWAPFWWSGVAVAPSWLRGLVGGAGVASFE